MVTQTRVLIVIAGAILLAGLLMWLLLPAAIDILPGDIRGRIPEELLSLVMTPLPSALPVSLPTPNQQPLPAQLLSSPTILPQEAREEDLISSTQIAPTETIVQQDPGIEKTRETPTPTITPVPIPPQVLIEGLNVLAQKFNNCGPANLAMVTNFFGSDIDQIEIASELRPNSDDRNVSIDEMVDYVNNFLDLKSAAFVGGDRYILKRLIAQGYPVIIEKGLIPSEWQGWMGHYLTLYGYSDYDRVFQAMDSYLGPWDGSGRLENYEDLEDLWEHFNYTFIVVYPESDEQHVAGILKNYGDDDSSMWQIASLKAQNTLNDNSENAFAWFNLGASLTNIAEITGAPTLYSGASAAFDEARRLGLPWRMLWYRFEPYRAYLGAGRNEEVIALADIILSDAAGRDVEETYLYRGLALEAEGRTAEAENAFKQALKLNPNSDLVSENILTSAANDDVIDD